MTIWQTYETIAKIALKEQRYGDAAKVMLAANRIDPTSVLTEDSYDFVSQVIQDGEYITIITGLLKVCVNTRRYRMSAEWTDTGEELEPQDVAISRSIQFPEGSWITEQVKQLQINMRTPKYYTEFD